MIRALRHFGSLYSLPRSPVYSLLTPDDLTYFRSILPASNILTTSLEGYNTDWMRIYQGATSLVLKPTNTSQVQAILRYCNDRVLAVCPQGGNTSLVGGSVPVHDEIVLNLTKMNRILGIDEQQGVIKAESGVVLEDLSTFCQSKGYIVPIDLASKGTCLIGGNVSTNAGGIRYLRYGSLHGNVLGLEVVLPSGEVIDNLNSMRKDNTGYDLKQLFIGSEGTLGVVTKVSVLLAQKPSSMNAVLFSCSSFQTVVDLLRSARRSLSEILSAYEFMDRGAVELVVKHLTHVKYPFKEMHPFYILIESSGSNQEHDLEKLNSFLEKTLEENPGIEGIVTQDRTQFEQVWALREGCVEGATKDGYVRTYPVLLLRP